MFFGNYLTIKKKKTLLLKDANEIIMNYKNELEIIGNYKFNKTYVNNTNNVLNVMEKIDKNFPNIYVIHKITYNSKEIFISFGNYSYWKDGGNNYESQFIYTSSSEERKYMNSIDFTNESIAPYFESKEGDYKLIIPIKTKYRSYFLILTDYQRYGKIGS